MNPELKPVFNPDIAPKLRGWLKQLKEENPEMTEEKAWHKTPKIHN